ncbi:MAG: hypothetical protein A2X94_16590 [Bdellovibrionales bacterium GWB1_55_8]|nr:MAG: hypothetical protein A2X94_16590 [Bdellovibrionales bacterium GWB1_55_8]
METGNAPLTSSIHPIEQQLIELAKRSSTEIRVHLSRRWIEKDPFGRATDLYNQFASSTAKSDENGVLIYLNLRRRKYAIYADRKPAQALGALFWDTLGVFLASKLKNEKAEVALTSVIAHLSEKLQHAFPAVS